MSLTDASPDTAMPNLPLPVPDPAPPPDEPEPAEPPLDEPDPATAALELPSCVSPAPAGTSVCDLLLVATAPASE